MTCERTESSASPVTPGTFEQALAHLVMLARQPGWKAHAWHRAKELDADRSGLFAGMAQALKDAMTGQAAGSVSEGQTSTKVR